MMKMHGQTTLKIPEVVSSAIYCLLRAGGKALTTHHHVFYAFRQMFCSECTRIRVNVFWKVCIVFRRWAYKRRCRANCSCVQCDAANQVLVLVVPEICDAVTGVVWVRVMKLGERVFLSSCWHSYSCWWPENRTDHHACAR